MKRRTQRPHIRAFRLTEAELIDLERMMSDEGYRSVSLFVRDRVFSVKLGSRKVRTCRDAGDDVTAFAASYASLISHVRKIGVNVNTACRNINASASRNEDGKMDTSMLYWLKKVSSYLYRIASLLERCDVGADSDNNGTS